MLRSTVAPTRFLYLTAKNLGRRLEKSFAFSATGSAKDFSPSFRILPPKLGRSRTVTKAKAQHEALALPDGAPIWALLRRALGTALEKRQRGS